MNTQTSSTGLLGLDEYRSHVKSLEKLDDAIRVLDASDDADLRVVARDIETASQRLADALAVGLAYTARYLDTALGKNDRYHCDDIWEALGRYAHSNDEPDNARHLLNLAWAIEQAYKKIVPQTPEPPEPPEDDTGDDPTPIR